MAKKNYPLTKKPQTRGFDDLSQEIFEGDFNQDRAQSIRDDKTLHYSADIEERYCGGTGDDELNARFVI